MPAEWEALPITAGQAREHLGWQYEPPYDFYNIAPKLWEREIRAMLQPAPGDCCYAVHRGGKMAGYFELHCRGKTVEIGVALRPDLTGKGHGRAFLACVLAQAWQFFYRNSSPCMWRHGTGGRGGSIRRRAFGRLAGSAGKSAGAPWILSAWRCPSRLFSKKLEKSLQYGRFMIY